MRTCACQILLVLLFGFHPCSAQTIDSLPEKIEHISGNFLAKIQKKYSGIEHSLNKKTTKYLQKLQRQEKKLQRKAGSDTSRIGNDIDSAYSVFINSISEKSKEVKKVNLGQYNAFADTLTTSLDFLQKYKGLEEKVKLPAEALDKLKERLNQTEKVKEFIAQRKQQMREVLSKYTKVPASLKKQYERLSKTAYYYTAQVKEYREMLSDPKKIEEKTLALLSQLPIFQKFIKENSQLASLFRLPGNAGSAQSLAGLQTRASVQGMIQQRIAAGGPSAMAQVQQNLAAAHAEIDKLKDKLNQFGGGGDPEMPDFKPNEQKTKPFLKRLEYSADVQFEKSSNLLPSAANIGLGIGYKLNDKGAIGVGMSYKAGMGTIQHINITHQGIGLRSYIDWKAPFGSAKWGILGGLYINGGYEMNYNAAFKNIEQLQNYECWQRSALIGLNKKYKVSKKVKGEMKLLYDFLANAHVPVSQPVVFRLGYKF